MTEEPTGRPTPRRPWPPHSLSIPVYPYRLRYLGCIVLSFYIWCAELPHSDFRVKWATRLLFGSPMPHLPCVPVGGYCICCSVFINMCGRRESPPTHMISIRNAFRRSGSYYHSKTYSLETMRQDRILISAAMKWSLGSGFSG